MKFLPLRDFFKTRLYHEFVNKSKVVLRVEENFSIVKGKIIFKFNFKNMENNILIELRQKYEIVAVDDYIQIPERIYISKSLNEVNELTEAIAIDLIKPAVWRQQKLGNYFKLNTPLRKILPTKDDIDAIWKMIRELPEIQFEELLLITQSLNEVTNEGYLKYYDLENYIFTTVQDNFQKEGSICAEDFFSIVIWKANRAKSNIAK